MRREQGFSLVELLVVITLLIILSTLAATGGMGFRDRARKAKTKAQIAQIETALEAYRNDFLKYPTDGSPSHHENNNPYTLEQLTGKNKTTGAFDTTVTSNTSWNGPYLSPKTDDVKVVSSERTLIDAWGNAFNFRLASDTVLDTNPPKNNRLTFDVWSNGTDGTNDSGTDGDSGLTDDDLGNF